MKAEQGRKLVIFGNSASGKSSLAKKLAAQAQLAHLDLDTLAWLPNPVADTCEPSGAIPQRQSLDVSLAQINAFIAQHDAWVIEGCYSDLLAPTLAKCKEIIFLNLPVALCIDNAKNRPWEPHKYKSKTEQDANLAMLIAWISQYETRTDTFSKLAHQRLFDSFDGCKQQYVNNQPVYL